MSSDDSSEKSKLLEELIHQDCISWEDYAKKGYAYFKLRDHENAVKYLTVAARKNPTDVVLLELLAQSLRNVGEDKKKTGVRMLVMHVLPRTEAAWDKQGEWLKEIDRDLYFMAWMTVKMGTSYSSEKEKELQIRIRKKPNDYKTWLELGMELSKNGSDEKAIEAYEKAIAIKPKDAEAWFRLGDSLGCIGEHIRAREAFQRAIELKRKDARAWLGLGISYIPAITPLLSTVLPFDEDSISDLVERLSGSLSEIAEEDIELAEQAFRTSIKLNKKEKSAWLWLGFLLMTRNRMQESEDALNQSVDLDLYDPLPHFFKALLYRTSKRDEEYRKATKRGFTLLKKKFGGFPF